MNPVVCVCYRPGDPSRDRSWAYARARWEAFGFRVVTGDCPELRWSVARGRNAAAAAAGDWEVALFADADEILETAAQGHQALRWALGIHGLVRAFETYQYLDEAATTTVLAGAKPEPSLAYYRLGRIWSGPFAIHRDLWDQVGGMDEAYEHYDGEDVAFIQEVTRVGPEKQNVQGDAYHLWHGIRGHIFRPRA